MFPKWKVLWLLSFKKVTEKPDKNKLQGECNMEKINTNKAPEALGPYTQAIKAGGFVFTSGQIAINPETNTVEAADIAGQAEQVCKNLCAVLEAAGTSIEKAVKTTCFLADMGDFAAFNEVYGKY